MKEKGTHIIALLENICKNDDQQSFEELFKLFYPRLLNFCIQYIKHKEPAEEIVSEVFVTCWVNRKSLSQIQNPETYLFIAVRNRALNYLKHFSKYRVTYVEEIGANSLINSWDPAQEMERKELLFKMDQAIESLPLQCRIIFRLIKEDGLKYKEVAEILNLSPRTVETQLVRAMKKLDKILSPYFNRHRAPFFFSLFF